MSIINFNINAPINKIKLIKLDIEIKKETQELEDLYALRDRYYAMKNCVETDNKEEMLKAMADKLEANGIVL
jgi:hypothetical protein